MVEPGQAGRLGSRGTLGLSFALGGWFALAVVAARTLVLFLLEHSHGSDWEVARLRLSNSLLALSCQALVVGVLGALLVILGDSLGLGSRARWGVRGGAAGVLASAATWMLSGRSGADLSQRVGLETARGQAVTALLACGALLLAALLVMVAARQRPGPLFSWTGAVLPLALLVTGAGTLRIARAGVRERMLVRSVEQELFAADWEVLEQHPDGGVGLRVLSPSALNAESCVGMPSLCLPPPARVRRAVPAGSGPLVLVGRAGIDHSVREDLGPDYADGSVRFAVKIDGELRHEERLSIERSYGWVALGPGSGLPVHGGAVLELETELLDGSGRAYVPRDPLPVGLGGLGLERHEELERVRSSSEAPNIVLVLVDTLRADRTSVQGYHRPTTPNLEALARRGVVFEEACSTSSWTWPATASLFTGMQPEEHGVVDAGSSFLPETLDTLAEALQRRGITTAAWSASPLIVSDKNFDQGFELFHGPRNSEMRPTAEVLPPALDWLGAIGDWRFFLYLHLCDPHAPPQVLPEARARFASEVPRSFDPESLLPLTHELRRKACSAPGAAAGEVSLEEQRWISDLYDASVWSVDCWIGRLLERLEALGLDERTIVVVTSDHGEELFDHGLLAHAHSLYRELVRVPLIAAGPGLPRGVRIANPVSIAALAPTLVRRAGGELAGLREATELFAEGPARPQELLFSTHQGLWNGSLGLPLYGILAEPYVLHFSPEGRDWGVAEPSAEGQWRLFDRRADPAEQRDIAQSEPERARALRAALLERVEMLEARRKPRAVESDPATLEMLRGLGYVGH